VKLFIVVGANVIELSTHAGSSPNQDGNLFFIKSKYSPNPTISLENNTFLTTAIAGRKLNFVNALIATASLLSITSKSTPKNNCA
jgi:hypothetical protein